MKREKKDASDVIYIINAQYCVVIYTVYNVNS